MINPDTATYLENVANRVELYARVRDIATKHLIKKKIKDNQKIENCIIMSHVWAADQLGELLTLQDLMIYLGADDMESIEELVLTEQYKNKTLIELLDLVIEADGSIWDK